MNVRTVAAFFGILGVGLGALGAHGSEMSPEAQNWARTASLYWLVHTAAMLGSGRSDGRATSATWFFAAGIALFGGSLFGMALLTDVRWLGRVTPIGGLALMVGWLQLIRRKD